MINPKGKPKFALISMGGTIAMTPNIEGGGVAPSLDAEALFAAVPGIRDFADVECISLMTKPGAHLTINDLSNLSHTCIELLRDDFCGVVVTQGTDTLEETAFFLDRTVASEKPVIVTGAMRAASAVSADGPFNLLSAAHTVVSSQVHGLGTLVVFDGFIHAARFVRKTHTHITSAFSSLNGPLVGTVAEDRVVVQWRPPRWTILPVPASPFPLVPIITTYLGDGGQLASTALSSSDAVVVETLGAGHVNPVLADLLEDAARRIPVIAATRVHEGGLLFNTYDFIGSEIDLRRRGIGQSGFLSPQAARICVLLLVAQNIGKDDTIELLTEYIM